MHTSIASWRSVSAEAHIRLNGPVTMQQLPPFYQKRFHVSGPQDGGAGTCLNPISFQRTSHHFFLLRLHLMMFACRIAVFRVMGWEAELDYSFLLDLRRRQSRVDGVIFGGANTAASAGSPKTSASLPGESCPMVTAAAGRGFKCPSVRSGAEMHRVTERRHTAAEKGAFGFSCFDCTRWLLSAGEGVLEYTVGTLCFPEQQTLSGATISEYPVLSHYTATVKLTAIWNSGLAAKCLVWSCQSVSCWQD